MDSPTTHRARERVAPMSRSPHHRPWCRRSEANGATRAALPAQLEDAGGVAQALAGGLHHADGARRLHHAQGLVVVTHPRLAVDGRELLVALQADAPRAVARARVVGAAE